jgi:DNA-3-methyladenine glycosylase II
LRQQVSIDSAKATFFFENKNYFKNGIPEILLHVSDAEFRNLGVSRQKIYIKALATAILNKDLI